LRVAPAACPNMAGFNDPCSKLHGTKTIYSKSWIRDFYLRLP
jgi:hypothetical protein